MKYIRQFGMICAICVAGDLVSRMLPFPIPGSVIGMVLLFVLLVSGLLKEEQIAEAGDFIYKNMAFFFIPSSVAILEHYSIIGGDLLKFVFICIVTTVLTFGVTAYTITGVISLQNKLSGRNNHA